MNRITRITTVALLGGGLLVGNQALAADKTLFFNYGQTPVFQTDTDNGNVYGNSFEFGVVVDDDIRAGIYQEEVTMEDAQDYNVKGMSFEYRLLGQEKFAAAPGLMVGSSDNNTSLVADLYGRIMLLASENSNLNARVAYRSAPDEGVGGAGNADGISLSVGFGLTF